MHPRDNYKTEEIVVCNFLKAVVVGLVSAVHNIRFLLNSGGYFITKPVYEHPSMLNIIEYNSIAAGWRVRQV